MNREALLAELETANADMLRYSGGVDPIACITAARRVTELRNTLRDNPAMFAHFAKVLAMPLASKRSRARDRHL